jgi:polyferredoxin
MAKQPARRQAIRKALILISLLLFPVTMNYLSPYVITDAASQGIVNGSMIVFTAMFLSALLVGRLWCGWACPAAGLQEMCFAVRDRPARGGRFDWIKWAIWFPWIGLIAFLVVQAGGYRRVDFFHLTESGISLYQPDQPQPFIFIIYYGVVGLVLILSLTAGRRAFCHYVCWMSPFMIVGRKIRNLARWPALRLKADAEKCIDCKRCTQNCPMSLDVNGLVHGGTMEHGECILCGTCVDVCPQDVIRYSFSGGR